MEKYNVLTPSNSVKVAANTEESCYNIGIAKVTHSGIEFRSSLCNTSNPPNLKNLPNPNNPRNLLLRTTKKTSKQLTKLAMNFSQPQGGLEPLLMSYPDVQFYLGEISRSTVERMVKRKELPQPVALSPRRKMFITRDVKNMISSRIKGGKKNAK